MWSDAARAAARLVNQPTTGGTASVGPAAVSGPATQAQLAKAGANSRGQWNGGRGPVVKKASRGAPAVYANQDKNAADALAAGHPKSRVVDLHSASAIAKGRQVASDSNAPKARKADKTDYGDDNAPNAPKYGDDNAPNAPNAPKAPKARKADKTYGDDSNAPKAPKARKADNYNNMDE